MCYYIMEPINKINLPLPTPPKNKTTEAIITVNQNQPDEIYYVDYDAHRELISDRLKQVIAMYLPEYEFIPEAIISDDKNGQTIYWKFKPPIIEHYSACYREDGIITHISFQDNDRPAAFTIQPTKGKKMIAVTMTIAESTLRHNITGVKFTRILELKEE